MNEINRESFLENILEDTRKFYLLENKNVDTIRTKKILAKDFIIYHLEKITFEEKLPRKEALENVISSMRIDGVNFLYLIVGTKTGVEFYFGVVRDKTDLKAHLEIDIDEIGNHILSSSISGNFRGSRLKKISNRKRIMNLFPEMNEYAVLEGVPGKVENQSSQSNEGFQGMDRLVDVMTGDEFVVSIIASPLSLSEIEALERELYDIYDRIHPRSKLNIQESEGTNEGSGKSKSTTLTNSTSSNTTEGNSKGKSFNKTKGKSSETTSESTQTGENDGKSSSKGFTKSDSTAEGISESSQVGKSSGHNVSFENTKKCLIDWIKYLDEIVLKRVDYGKSKGLFHTNIFFATKNKTTLYKLGNTMQALFSGNEGNKVPLAMREVDNENIIKSLSDFQHPLVRLGKIDEKEREARIALSQNPAKNGGRFNLGNWMSTDELSLICGIPQKEVVGLQVVEEVEFGLNMDNHISEKDSLYLGHMVRSGEPIDIPVKIDKSKLDKHTFVTGVTGSGKTTTCLKLLLGSELPFLVIEPAKTEYRVLKNIFDDLLIFTLGSDTVAPFRLNPFEFFQHENISSRVDMIKASIEAAFDMEAAIPQIIESALYRSYKDYGWNVTTNKNRLYEDPFKDGVYAFPTLSDLIRNVELVADDQGFDERLRNDYVGSIKARLQGLTVGAKGAMLNTPRSIDFEDLLNRKVVLELEEIRNGNEKSLVIGFVISHLMEAIRANYIKQAKKGEKFGHITLIEEAHRLLTRTDPGDNPSKKLGVETFADMLAEVRKYGEALVIVDQIPNKLTPEVLKNTNTKIIHKIFAKDDKEAIGNTIALDDKQKNFLSNLSVGRVILNSEGFIKPVQVQIEENKTLSTTLNKPIDEELIHDDAIKYYASTYKRGVIKGVAQLDVEPSKEIVRKFLELNREAELERLVSKFLQQNKKNSELHQLINQLSFDTEEIVKFIFKYMYETRRQNEELLAYLKSEFCELANNHEYYIKHEKADLYKIDKVRSVV